MAIQATYIGIVPRTITADVTALVRGVRVTETAGVCALALISVRGDFGTLTSVEASLQGEGFSMQSAGRVPLLAGEDVTIDDDAYTMANGLTGKTSGGGAIYIGKWSSTTASGTLGVVELQNPA